MVLQLDDGLDRLEDERCADILLLFLGRTIVAHTVLENAGEPLVVQRALTVGARRANARPATAASLDRSTVGKRCPSTG